MLTLNSSGLWFSLGLFNNNYLHVSGTRGNTFANKFSMSFSNTIAWYLNLFFVEFLVREKVYELTMLIEHKSSSSFVASFIKSGWSLNSKFLKFYESFFRHFEH